MTLKDVALRVLAATESAGMDFMLMGVIAAGAYGTTHRGTHLIG